MANHFIYMIQEAANFIILHVQVDLLRSVACTINIYDHRFYDHNDIGLYYNTLETIVIDYPSLS